MPRSLVATDISILACTVVLIIIIIIVVGVYLIIKLFRSVMNDGTATVQPIECEAWNRIRREKSVHNE